jgi:beta-lactam-binding protein with PASTA domain
VTEVSVTVATPRVRLQQGRSSVTVSVTNGGAVPQRIVLTAIGPPVVGPSTGHAPTGGTWAMIPRPLREIGPGATEQYVAEVVPEGAPPGTHRVTFVAYPADRAPEEYRDRGQTVDVVVPPAAGSVRRRPPWWLAAVAVGLVVVLGAVAYALTRPSTTIIVPGVVGKSLAEAESDLRAARLDIAVETEVGPEPLDTVIRQNPDEGSEAEVGETVYVVVRVGVVLPESVGRSLEAASNELVDAGLSVEVVTEESDEAAGSVLSMDPPAGTEVGAGSAVRLSVATERLVSVPDVLDLDVAAAEQAVEGAGLLVRLVQEPLCSSPFGSSCSVVSQVPEPTARVPRGSVVTLIVGG